jgi:hypothetical protein
MTAPGVQVLQRTTLPPRSVPADTSTWFVAGVTERGPQAPASINSMAAFTSVLGQRLATSVLYDAAETFFREGGARMIVSRVLGPAAAVATKNLLDGSAAIALVVNANSKGAWGNNLKVAVVAGGAGGTYQLQVLYNNVLVEQSGDLLDTAAGVAWSTGSQYVTITQGASTNDPAVVAAASLTGGSDDTGSIVDATWKAALDAISRDLGAGMVSMPGRTTDQAHLDTLSHAAANNRVAVLDAPDTAVVATLTSSATAARAGGNGKYGALFAPWAIVPGIATGTTRTVPYSAVVAGIVGRNENLGYSANDPAAGEKGIARYAIGLSQNDQSDANRDLLNTGGVNMARILDGSVKTYGWRSLADPAVEPQWLNFGNARLFTAISADAGFVGDQFVFDQIDGQGLTISQYGGELAAMLLVYYNEGALYGQTPDEAFSVDVGDQVNTDATIAAGELHAVLAVKMSPMAEHVIIEVVKVDITQEVV